MKLTTLRVENFKCVDDSTPFETDQITCLLGKNEAGKSALLEALYKLNPFEDDKGDFELEEFPRRRVSTYRERKDQKEHANVLTTTWTLEAADREAVTALYGPEALHVDDKGRSFVVFTKGYDNVLKPSVVVDDAGVARHYLETSRLSPDEQAPLREAASIRELIQALDQDTKRGPNHQTLLATLQKTFPSGDAATAIGLFLKERLPVFLYFREYDKLPGRVSLQDYKNRKAKNTLEKGHKIFAALLELANSSPEDIEVIEKLERLTMELEAVQARLSDEIFEYWSQNKHLSVKFSCDQGRDKEPPPFNAGMVFTTRIWNDRHRASVLLDQRSSGFLWFFSFLVWFSQVEELERSHLLDGGRLLKTTDFTRKPESDIEDMLGWPLYAALVNGALGLPSHLALPATNPGTHTRVVKAVEEILCTLPPGFPEFDHYQPVGYLHALPEDQAQKLPGFAEAADLFEALFRRLNELIASPDSPSAVAASG